MLSIEDFYGKDGLIAQVKPDFSAREGQQYFSELIYTTCNETPESIEQRKHIIAEAPTGFGKSFAVLIPAIVQAINHGERFVISTETIALQDQYINKDLPLLQKAVEKAGYSFSFAAAKGKSNYICRSKCAEDLPNVYALRDWANKQQIRINSGDLSTVPIAVTPTEWKEIAADDTCEKQACPFYIDGRLQRAGATTDCFAYQAARDYIEADIVVTNHTLLLLDAELEAGSLLGKYNHVIIDEAHSLPEIAQNTWGVEIRHRTISSTLILVGKMLDRNKIEFFEDGFIQKYRSLEDAIFEPLQPIINKGQSVRISELPKSVTEEAKNALLLAMDSLKDINAQLTGVSAQYSAATKEKVAIGTAKERVTELIKKLDMVFGDGIPDDYKNNWLSFLDVQTAKDRKRKFGVLNLKPIEVAPLMRAYLLQVPEIHTVILMSATMRIGKSFAFMKRELGLSAEYTVEYIGESPFDFEKQVKGYFPKHLPFPDVDTYPNKLAEEIIKVVEYTNGRALILFTNIGLMNTIYQEVSLRLKYRCFIQGEMSKAALIKAFTEDTHSCLFATRSFFTGVDIPGETLSCVIMTRAPFRVPTDPMFKAKSDIIDDRGGDSFNELSMPLMLFDIKQAFGRLIRTTTDTGVFAFLDSRANKKAYSSRIRKALPSIQIYEKF